MHKQEVQAQRVDAILNKSDPNATGTFPAKVARKNLNKTQHKRAMLMASLVMLTGATHLFAPQNAQAQEAKFPSRPISLIVPWPPGGSTDRHLRAFAEAASKQLGQPVIIVNNPGVGGTLGPTSMAAQAKPDGYTLSQFPMGMLRLPHMQKVSFDPLKDFTFVIGITGYTFGLTVKADSPYKSLQEYLSAAKAKPNQVSFASTGVGTSPHLLIEELALKAGVQLNHVPFKGNADSTQALLGGHVDSQSDATGWGRFVDAGQMRLLVTFGENRTKRWPTVPTAKELGLGIVSTSPYGIAGPKGMDPAIVKILHDAFKKAIDDPDHQKVLEQLDQDVWYKNSEDYAKWARETFASERALINRLGLAPK
jgi:tripartite-type tricarboxylate transporter receptor subunit TctC